jgi:hypothetical protein
MKILERVVFAVAVAGLLSGVAFGQSATGQANGKANGQANGQDKSNGRISHVGLGPKGNKIHHFFSVTREKDYRAQQSGKGTIEAQCSNTKAGDCTGLAMVYNGGPVMRNPTNYLIFWVPQSSLGAANNVSAGFPAGFTAGIENFFNNLSGTPFYNIVTQYNDSTGVPVPNSESLGAPSWVDTSTVAPSGCDGTSTGTYGNTPHCPIQDSDIQNEVNVALAANPTWLSPSNNVEYFVFTPAGIGECSNQSSGIWQCFGANEGLGPSQTDAFCAYHSNFGSTIYAYEPFASDGNCIGSDVGPTPNLANYPTSAAVDVQLSPVSHEMMESNTDPIPTSGWTGPNGGSDEIGDKCAYDYGYVAPDGTNVVLNGNRFQIQTEFSNDLTNACGGANAPPYCACTKRYGQDPGISFPASMDFGEVDGGNKLEKDLVIQNSSGGALNILNVRLDNTSSPDFSLLNVPPSAATLPAGESLTVQVQFAPPNGAGFAHPLATVVVDTDQTQFNTTTQTASNEDDTSVTSTVGVSPVANCQSVTVPTDPNMCSTSVASVNNGSYDPDTESVTVIQTPGGPYALGTTPVTLLVEDSVGDSASCVANVTVKDLQKPTITCPAAQTISCTSSSGAAATVTPTVFDNCPAVKSSCVPGSGTTFGFGTTPVTCTATDTSGNMSSCMTSVTVTDVAPVIASLVASPALLSPPNKKMVPVTMLVKESDLCDPSPSCTITAVTANQKLPASDIQITGPLTVNLANAGTGGHPLTYIVTVTCADHHGGSTSAQTSVISE